jgi:hypothetical protein
MMRTQIQLTESQHRAIKRWASRLGISLAEAIRRCVAERLSRDGALVSPAERAREARAVVGKYADPSGPSRVAQDHDDHLADAYRA